MTGNRVVMGIDPGIARVGYGLVMQTSQGLLMVHYGCIQTEKDLATAARLHAVYREIGALLDEYRPESVSVERLFFTQNVTSAMQVSEVRGVILLAAYERQIPIAEYTPQQIKQAVSGSGRADKKQVQEMVKRLLALEHVPRPDDAADGLAAAICQIHMGGTAWR